MCIAAHIRIPYSYSLFSNSLIAWLFFVVVVFSLVGYSSASTINFECVSASDKVTVAAHKKNDEFVSSVLLVSLQVHTTFGSRLTVVVTPNIRRTILVGYFLKSHQISSPMGKAGVSHLHMYRTNISFLTIQRAHVADSCVLFPNTHYSHLLFLVPIGVSVLHQMCMQSVDLHFSTLPLFQCMRVCHMCFVVLLFVLFNWAWLPSHIHHYTLYILKQTSTFHTCGATATRKRRIYVN